MFTAENKRFLIAYQSQYLISIVFFIINTLRVNFVIMLSLGYSFHENCGKHVSHVVRKTCGQQRQQLINVRRKSNQHQSISRLKNIYFHVI